VSELKLCQGVKCHTYNTKDRLKGVKGSKTFQTRRRSSMYYGNGNFCSLNCQNDWFQEFGNRAIDHFGRLTEPKHLTKDKKSLLALFCILFSACKTCSCK